MEIEESLNVAAFTGLENSVVAQRQPVYLTCKRMTDFVLALIGLIVLSPVFLFVALLIKWDDPKGTIFFSQDRVGKDEELFKMYQVPLDVCRCRGTIGQSAEVQRGQRCDVQDEGRSARHEDRGLHPQVQHR